MIIKKPENIMPDDTGLLYSYLLDGKGGGVIQDWEKIKQWEPSHGMIWIHLEYSNPVEQEWLLNQSGLDEISAGALLAEETRPRSMRSGGGLLLTLRGINSNPDSASEDMVSIRLWSDGKRIISTRRRRLMAANEIRQDIELGKGPCDASEFVETLTDRMVDGIVSVIDQQSDEVDDLEEQVLTLESHELRPKIAQLRRRTIGLHRFLAPQREAVTRLFNEKLDWLSEIDRMRLRENADRMTRFVEELDLTRERAVVVQQELVSRLSEKMENTMYVLSIVSAIFLPLGFLTGLLGINVGGIPGTDYKGSFVIFCIAIVIIVVAQIWFFKKKKWM